MYEVACLKKYELKKYFKDIWNTIDLLLILFYIPTAIVDVVNREAVYVTIAYCLILIMAVAKLFSYLRIFDNFSFLVSMLLNVFFDVRYFLIFYFIIISLFGLMFNLLKIQSNDDNDAYQGISYAGYYVMAYRASIGDF